MPAEEGARDDRAKQNAVRISNALKILLNSVPGEVDLDELVARMANRQASDEPESRDTHDAHEVALYESVMLYIAEHTQAYGRPGYPDSPALPERESSVVCHQRIGNEAEPIKVYADGRHVLVIDADRNPVYEFEMSSPSDVGHLQTVLGLMEYGARGFFEDPE